MTSSTRRTSRPHSAPRTLARGAAVLAVAIAAMIGACTEVGTDPSAAVSIAFDTLSLPAPAVVVGDTMRDTSGAAAPLVARAFNADGDVIADAPIAFVYVPADTSDTARAAVKIENGYVIAADTAPTGLAYRVVAQIGSLQSQSVTFSVVPRPDSADVPPQTSADTIIAYGNTDTTKLRAIVEVLVLHDSTDAATGALVTTVPVSSYPVEFRIDSGAPAVLDSAKFVVGRRRSDVLLIKTASSGAASATVRVYPKVGGAATPDSIVVKGYVSYGGPPRPGPLRGTPVRRVVRLDPSFGPPAP